MPRGVPKKAAKGSEVNRAELIRKTAAALGKTVRPRDIAVALREKGVTVSGSLISKTLKRAGHYSKSRGEKAKAVASEPVGQINKAQRIRDVAKALGKKVRPKDVIAELAKEGIVVSSAQVSTTLSAAGYRRKRRNRKAAIAAVAHPTNGNGLDLDALIAAKALIAKVGSIEVAQDALAALKRLG
jgi:23S rRNA pseudoU1915 N3-methylase RlmH